MKDFLRVLKPGGVMRIAMPDLEHVVHNYINVPIEEDPVIKKFNFTDVKTRAEWMNMSFREWGHKWLYDFEELDRRLREAGFRQVERCELRQSKHKELCNLEIRDESFLIVEVVK
jgi:predicted SAM-dependent methyltransferase